MIVKFYLLQMTVFLAVSPCIFSFYVIVILISFDRTPWAIVWIFHRCAFKILLAFVNERKCTRLAFYRTVFCRETILFLCLFGMVRSCLQTNFSAITPITFSIDMVVVCISLGWAPIFAIRIFKVCALFKEFVFEHERKGTRFVLGCTFRIGQTSGRNTMHPFKNEQ